MQLRELRAYVQHLGLPITEEFIDQASSTMPERPALDQLWHAVRARQVDTVLVWTFDRFARSNKQLILATEELQHLSVYFIFHHRADRHLLADRQGDVHPHLGDRRVRTLAHLGADACRHRPIPRPR